MAKIFPFKGVLYSEKLIKELQSLVTEPYDLISSAKRDYYYTLHPYNIIRLTLGKEYPGDNSRDNKYSRSGGYFTDWQRQGILSRDRHPAFYIYSQNYFYRNKPIKRVGFIALTSLEDFTARKVLPHEATFSRTVNDRFKLLTKTKANLSPIFAMFVDQKGSVDKLLKKYVKGHKPRIVIKKEGVVHRLWAVREKKFRERIKDLFKDNQIFIADGHHRYRAALTFLKHSKLKRNFKPSFSRVMTYLVPCQDLTLTIFPTHRVVRKLKIENKREVFKKLKPLFIVSGCADLESMFAAMQKKKNCFGMYLGKNKFYCLKLKKTKSLHKFLEKDPQEFRDLDVSLLHKLILKSMTDAKDETAICYTRHEDEAIRLVDCGSHELVFFLNPPKTSQVCRIAQAQLKMPHKSTYFYPKPLTGLAINKF